MLHHSISNLSIKVSGCLLNPLTLYASMPFLGNFFHMLNFFSEKQFCLNSQNSTPINTRRQVKKERGDRHTEKVGYECSWSNKSNVLESKEF